MALRLPARHKIVKSTRPNRGQVFFIGHAAIDHHGRPLLEADALTQAIEHGGERGAILGIAGEHLVGDRKAIAVDYEPNHDLFAIRSMVA